MLPNRRQRLGQDPKVENSLSELQACCLQHRRVAQQRPPVLFTQVDAQDFKRVQLLSFTSAAYGPPTPSFPRVFERFPLRWTVLGAQMALTRGKTRIFEAWRGLLGSLIWAGKNERLQPNQMGAVALIYRRFLIRERHQMSP